MLSLDAIDLETLCMALEHQSDGDIGWWLDGQNGEIIFLSSDTGDEPGESEEELEDRGAVRIEPVSPREAYRDMESFISGIQDERAMDVLQQAISGKGAFRRFKDRLTEFPKLRAQWFAFHDQVTRRRAIEWLVDVGVIDLNEAERALKD